MKLIDEWKSAHKFWSVRLAGATAALASADWLLPNLVGVIPKWTYVILALGIFGARIVSQGPKSE